MRFFKDSKKILLIVILLVAALLRFANIDTNPKSMYGDGITLVYDAYSILKTGGYDQRGNFLPLVFELGGGRPAGYIYADIPFVAVLGPTATAALMVSVLSGIGIVFLLYLLGSWLFSRQIGLWAAALAAVSPWELSLSRGPFESHLALFLALAGVYGFFRALKDGRWAILAALGFGLAVQTYPTYRLSIPIFCLFLLLVNHHYQTILRQLKNPIVVFSILLLIFSIAGGTYLTLSRQTKDRFSNINLLNRPDIKSAISQKTHLEKTLDTLPPQISGLFHNKAVEFTQISSEYYFKNFFPSFLFVHGDGNPRHNPAAMGEFYWVDLLLIFLGLLWVRRRHFPNLPVLVGWILIAPIPTALVGEPHAIRSSFLLPPLLLLSAAGAVYLQDKLKSRWVRWVGLGLVLVFVVQFAFFLDRFYFLAPDLNINFWSYTAKEAASIAQNNLKSYDYIILSNDIDNMEFAYPTYTRIDPRRVIEQNHQRAKLNGREFFRYGNVYIGSMPTSTIAKFIKDLPGRVLYVGPGLEQQFLENYIALKEKDGTIGLLVVTKGNISPNLDRLQ